MDKHKPYGVELVENAPQGTTIYTVLRKVSSSGMTRTIDAVIIKDGEPYYLRTALMACGFKADRTSSGVKIQGAGMDMGFHLVYSLGQRFHGDGYYFGHRWL